MNDKKEEWKEEIMEVKWFEDLEHKYRSGICNTFILHGNIGDYATPGITFMNYLYLKLEDLRFGNIFTYNKGSGLKPVKCLKSVKNRSFTDMCGMIEEGFGEQEEKTAIIIEYPEFLIPDLPVTRMTESVKGEVILLHEAVNSQSFLDSDNIVIFVSETKSEINKRFVSSNSRSHTIQIDFPNEQERYEMITYLDNTSKQGVKCEISLKQLAKMTAGLTRVSIEDIYLQAEQEGFLRREFIVQRKNELIQREYGEVIEIFDTDGYSFKNYAGQEHLKCYHREMIIEPMIEGDVSYVPKGVLYTGPPGTGKTHFAKCLAGEAGINFVEFRMSKILDMWLGEAEKRFEKALTCFRSIAPVGVFIDEIDQVFTRGESSQGQVSKNLFGMFLSVLSEPSNRGKILWVSATNYPNKLDDALKRTGRFDKKIPFLPPSKEARIQVFRIHLKGSHFEINISDDDYNTLAELTEGYTQAEIEGIVSKAQEVAKRKKQAFLDVGTLVYAIENTVSAKSSEILKMIEIALDECNDLELLPPEYREAKKEVEAENAKSFKYSRRGSRL